HTELRAIGFAGLSIATESQARGALGFGFAHAAAAILSNQRIEMALQLGVELAQTGLAPENAENTCDEHADPIHLLPPGRATIWRLDAGSCWLSTGRGRFFAGLPPDGWSAEEQLWLFRGASYRVSLPVEVCRPD